MEMAACDLAEFPKLRSGKVREVFDLGDRLMIVATDRISAFDCILPNVIPDKGRVLTGLSAFWFGKLDFVPNHFIGLERGYFPEPLHARYAELAGRAMIARKASPLPVECVVRGYLAGSAWAEYAATGAVCGEKLPPGLRMADRLETPIFTPATKAETGHDENISWAECRRILGHETALQVREWSLELYEHGRAFAARMGITIADTKFEFGVTDDEVILIDECLTPDSSRFWPSDAVVPGENPPSFDKQFVRDYLDGLDWDKTPPAPALPHDVVERTAEKYREAYRCITGFDLPSA